MNQGRIISVFNGAKKRSPTDAECSAELGLT